MKRTGLGIFTFLFTILFLVSSCNSNEEETLSVSRQKTIIFHTIADPTGLNPLTSVGTVTNTAQNLIFDKILDLDYETLELRPTLTDQLPTISEDKLEYTFKLSEGIKFSDGKPLTAEDILFTFKAIMNPFVDSAPVRAELHNFIDCIIVDERTVVFKLSESGPKNLEKIAVYFYVIPKHVYDPDNLTDEYSAQEGARAVVDRSSVSPEAIDEMKRFSVLFSNEKFQRDKNSVVGSGRYKLDEWVTDQYVRFVKNDNYWKQGSDHPFDMQNMDTIIFNTINSLETALISLRSGEIDFTDQLKPSQVHEKRLDKQFNKFFKIEGIPYPQYEYIGWNANIKDQPQRNFFADTKVRWAMSYLVDVREIIDNVMYNSVVPITSMVYYRRPEYNNDLKVIEPDTAKALRLLEEAGWKDITGDGWIEKDIEGTIVPFEFKLYYRQGNDIRRNIALMLEEKFKKVGIKVEVISLDWGIMLEKLMNHELDAWVGGWEFDSNEQDFYQLFHSTQINDGGFNWTSYSSPLADSLMEGIHTEWDTEKRYDMHRQIQRIVYDDQPYSLLFGNTARIAFNRRLATDKWYGQRPCFDLPQFYLVSETQTKN